MDRIPYGHLVRKLLSSSPGILCKWTRQRTFFSVRWPIFLTQMAENTAPRAPDVALGTADLGTVFAMIKLNPQLRASAQREDRLTTLLEKELDHEQPSPPVAGAPALPPVSNLAPSTASTKTVSGERPMLVVSATMADFVAWEEAWSDYSRCQHLEAQHLATQRAALPQRFQACTVKKSRHCRDTFA